MNQLSRRGFFGASAAVAVAGPTAAKSALAEMAGHPSRLSSALGSQWTDAYAGETLHPDSPTALQSRLKDLLERRSHIVSADPCKEPQIGDADLAIDVLRSVSLVNRARMIQEGRRRRELALNLSWTDRQIADIKKQLGPLGMLF